MNFEAGSIYPFRERLEEAKITTCFSDYHDLMVAARMVVRQDIFDKLLDTIHQRMIHASGMYLEQSSKFLGERPNNVTHKDYKIFQGRG